MSKTSILFFIPFLFSCAEIVVIPNDDDVGSESNSKSSTEEDSTEDSEGHSSKGDLSSQDGTESSSDDSMSESTESTSETGMEPDDEIGELIIACCICERDDDSFTCFPFFTEPLCEGLDPITCENDLESCNFTC